MGLLSKLLKRNKLPKTKYPTQYAFTCNGVDYHEFIDFNNMPPLRGLKTMVFYEEARMKTSLEFLKYHTEAIDNILTQPKINIFELKKLNEQLKERLSIALDTELVYKLASVVFFDNKEALDDYDFSYNIKKIESWKQADVDSFFLLMPLQKLMPALQSIDENFQKYSQVVQELNKKHWEDLLHNLPQKQMEILKNKSYSFVTGTSAK